MQEEILKWEMGRNIEITKSSEGKNIEMGKVKRKSVAKFEIYESNDHKDCCPEGVPILLISI